jgi:hypothetical protein
MFKIVKKNIFVRRLPVERWFLGRGGEGRAGNPIVITFSGYRF